MIATAVGAGAKRASAAPPSPVTRSATCNERYNAILQQAKKALVKGDRNGAIRALVDARSKLMECERREQLNSAPASGVAFDPTVFQNESFSG